MKIEINYIYIFFCSLVCISRVIPNKQFSIFVAAYLIVLALSTFIVKSTIIDRSWEVQINIERTQAFVSHFNHILVDHKW